MRERNEAVLSRLNKKTNEWQKDKARKRARGWLAGSKRNLLHAPKKKYVIYLESFKPWENTKSAHYRTSSWRPLPHIFPSILLFSLFHVFLWLPANLFAPSQNISFTSRKNSKNSWKGHRFLLVFLCRITHNGGLKPSSRSAYLLLIGCQRQGLGPSQTVPASVARSLDETKAFGI